ncbi:MAG TPA: hypothetical protein VFJ22_07825 [Dermatophilaceae bacterium]|jgi:hypothetical protein|nr:hypothetical protein [Dermatophilaceae bacterium]
MSQAGAALAQLDQDTARTAKGALSWLLPEDGDIDDILQLRLEEFLWYHLPVKWIADPQELHETAWALGDFLERAGKQRYAGLCRSQDTHLLLDAWQTSWRSARRQMQRLIDQSGVYRSTPTWSRGAPRWGWPSSKPTAMRAWPWTGRSTRAGWLPPPRVGRRRLLRSSTTHSATLCATGRARSSTRSSASARRPGQASLLLHADSRYHWFEHHAYGSIRGEENLQQVRALHDLIRRTRLVTLRKGRLSLSRAGRRAFPDSRSVWRVVVEGLFDPSEPPGDAAAIWSALLLSGAEGPVPEGDAREQTVTMLRERWHPTSGGVASPYELYWATWDFAALAPVFGWGDKTGGSRIRNGPDVGGPHGNARGPSSCGHRAASTSLTALTALTALTSGRQGSP